LDVELAPLPAGQERQLDERLCSIYDSDDF